MPNTRRRGAPSPDDSDFSAFQAFWQRLTRQERATLILMHTELTIAEIANLCRVHVRTLYRDDRFRRAKALCRSRPSTNTKWQGRLRRRLDLHERGFSDPDDPTA